MENIELKERFIDERTGIEYHLEGDYYIPNLTMPNQEKITLNKYGRMRFYTSFGYLGKDKWAENIPEYMEEITKQTKGKPKFIKFVPTQQAQIQDREQQAFI